MQGQQQGNTKNSLFMNRILTFELLLATRARRMVALRNGLLYGTITHRAPRMWARCSPWSRNGVPTTPTSHREWSGAITCPPPPFLILAEGSAVALDRPKVPRFIALRRAVRRVLDGQPCSTDPNTQPEATKGTHDDIETIEQRANRRSTSAEYWTDKLAKRERQDARALPTSTGGNHRHPAGEGTIRMCRITPKRITTDDQKAEAISPADATPQSLAKLWGGEAPD